MIQVELAGQRLPKTFEFVPDDIINMAQKIQSSCTEAGTSYGGFVTDDMEIMKHWIVSFESWLSRPFRKRSETD